MPFLFWALVALQLWCIVLAWMAVDTAQREAPHLRTINGYLESQLASSKSILASQEQEINILRERIDRLKNPNQQP